MAGRTRLFSGRVLDQAVQVAADVTDGELEVAATWARVVRSPGFDSQNERSHQGPFLTEFFGGLLGYRLFGRSESGEYELIAEEASTETVGGQTPDGQLGFFDEQSRRTIAVIELKRPSADLDAKQPQRTDRRTPIEQGFGYVPKFDGCRWVVVSNFRTLRLYWTVRGEGYYWECNVASLDNPVSVAELIRVLHRRNLLGTEPDDVSPTTELAEASRTDEVEITEAFYGFFKRSRASLFDAIVAANPPAAPEVRAAHETALLGHTQTLLDRLLFVCFSEDTDLLPRGILRLALDHAGAGFARTTRWQQLRGLFDAINIGKPDRGIDGYNGGLFAANPELESLTIADHDLDFVYEMSSYDFSDRLGVEVLGRIFERSIVDIEALHSEINPDAVPKAATKARSKRSQEGVFYTPDWVTRFLADQTVGAWVDDRYAALRDNVGVDDVPEHHTVKRRTAEMAFWEAWQDELRSIRVLDPACGSGAFLVAAFDTLHREYERANAELARLRGGQAGLFDPDKDILESNLYGVDINSESVEITRLSLWLKTAKRGRPLTTLSDTIRCGNSLIDPPAPDDARRPAFDRLAETDRAAVFDWRSAFPDVFDPAVRPEGRVGFDIVLGNPPYVRGEWLDPSVKDYFEVTYDVFGRKADLLVYFYERAVSLMAQSGRLGYIVSNKWLKAGYGEPLRRYLADHTRLNTLVDFGHAPIFQDADTFPIMTMLTPANASTDGEVTVAAVPRHELGAAGLTQLVADRGFAVARKRFGSHPWSLEPPEVQDLLESLSQHPTLAETVGSDPLRGLVTGMNDAYIIDQRTWDRLVAADPSSAAVIRPMARGSDVGRWSVTPHEYMIGLASSDDHIWPWTNGDDPEATFAEVFPAIHRWFTTDQHCGENRLERMRNRQDQGRHWWELRRCRYYDTLGEPKLIYTDIAWQPEVAIDPDGLFLNNSAYFIPGADRRTAAVLNSPLIWWYAWRTFQHGKDEALRWFTSSVSAIPSATSGEHRAVVENAVRELTRLVGERTVAHQATLRWLRSECNVVRPGNRLGDPTAILTADIFIEEAKQHGRFAPTSAAIADLTREHADLTAIITKSLALERDHELTIVGAVEQAYGLTDEQRALLIETAPPANAGVPDDVALRALVPPV